MPPIRQKAAVFSNGVRRSLIPVLLFVAGIATGLLIASMLLPKEARRASSSPTEQRADKKFPNTGVFKFHTLATGLQSIEFARIPVGRFSSGGVIAAVGNFLLVASPQGRIGFIRQNSDPNNYELNYTDAQAPMNRADLERSPIFQNPLFNERWFRTLDMTTLKGSDGRLYLYVSHHRFVNSCIQVVVSRIPINVTADRVTADNSGWEEIFAAAPCVEMKASGNFFAGHRAGGRLAKGPGSTLFLTLGDHELDGVNGDQEVSMDASVHLGKLIEIDVETKAVQIFASGLRNPQGLYVSSDGLIWETEHGPFGGDEINVLKRGLNYGWPKVTYGVNYGFGKGALRSRDWPGDGEQGRHEGYAKPTFAFLPSIAIGNLIEISSDEFPLWKGDLLAVSLKGESMWRLRRDGERIIYSERIPFGVRLRDIEQLPDGRVAVLTDSAELLILRGKRYREPSGAGDDATVTVAGLNVIDQVFPSLPRKPGEDDKSLGKAVFQAHCAQCHSVSPRNMEGPNLAGIVGRRIGSAEGYSYSPTLANAKGEWTKERLLEFLADPQKNFKGTAMPNLVLATKYYEVVVKYLKSPQ